MKLFGDVPDKHKSLAIALDAQEKSLDADTVMDRALVAKCYVCLAHDWYQMGMDEEGVRLLAKAEKIFPGYYKTMIAKHCYEHGEFEGIVRNITAELVHMLVSKLGEKK